MGWMRRTLGVFGERKVMPCQRQPTCQSPRRAVEGLNVPIRAILKNEHPSAFGPEDIENLTTAFEAALSKLGLVDRNDPATIAIAKLIIISAKKGISEPTRLCDHVVMLWRNRRLLVSPQVARERARPPRDGSNRHVSKRTNQKLLEQLEAENAQLRAIVVDLLLQIQALRDGAK